MLLHVLRRIRIAHRRGPHIPAETVLIGDVIDDALVGNPGSDAEPIEIVWAPFRRFRVIKDSGTERNDHGFADDQVFPSDPYLGGGRNIGDLLTLSGNAGVWVANASDFLRYFIGLAEFQLDSLRSMN